MRSYKLQTWGNYCQRDDGALVDCNSQEYIDWLAVGNTPLPADQPTLTDVKLAGIVYINRQADAAFGAITAGYPAQEVATWPNQYAEAWALQSDPLAYTPTLTSITTTYDVPVAALATSVLAKAAAYTVASGQIVGKRKKLHDQINACLTNSEVEAVTW